MKINSENFYDISLNEEMQQLNDEITIEQKFNVLVVDLFDHQSLKIIFTKNQLGKLYLEIGKLLEK